MDTLYWTGLNPDIKFSHTTRMMYGQFLYKLSFEIPGSNLLRFKGDLNELVEQRNRRSYNYGGSWRQPRPIDLRDRQLLALAKTVVDELSEEPDVAPRGGIVQPIRVRIEEPNVHFYTTSVQDMVILSKKMLFDNNRHFAGVTHPADANSATLMKDGFVLRKKDFDWKFKVVLRDGRYSEDTKTQLANYLTELGSEVKVPLGLTRQLDRGGWIWGGYFYTNDPQLTTIVSLINPGLVSKIEEFKVVGPGK